MRPQPINLTNLFTTATVCLSLCSGTLNAREEDIYSIHFSEDGKYLITCGASGFTLGETQKHTGGIKIWNSETGNLEASLSQRSDLDSIFAQQYGRVGSRRWGISNFKFATVIPKRSLIMFGEDGLPHSYGEADKIVLLGTENGERTELEVTNSMTEGKRCVTDISPDSSRVAVGCKGGLLGVYHARTGKLIWQDNGLMQVQYDTPEQLHTLVDIPSAH